MGSALHPENEHRLGHMDTTSKQSKTSIDHRSVITEGIKSLLVTDTSMSDEVSEEFDPLTHPAALPSTSVSGQRGQQLVEYRVYIKLTLRHHGSAPARSARNGLFFFSNSHDWAMAAHAIHEELRDRVKWSTVIPVANPKERKQKDPLLTIPFHFSECKGISESLLHWDGKVQTIRSILIVVLDGASDEDIFWNSGLEMVSILIGAFTDTERLVSEYAEATIGELFGVYVYFVTKLILKDCGRDGYAKSWGVYCLMTAIDLVRRKYPFDSTVWVVPTTRKYAQAAGSHYSQGI